MALAELEVPPPVEGVGRLVRVYLIGNAVALAAFWFVPIGGWLHAFWQTLAMWISVAFMLVGVRRLQPERAVAWYLIGAGVLLNACGVTVELMAFRFFGVRTSPNVADAFWSALFPAVAAGMGLLAHRAVAREEMSAMLRNTLICVPVMFFTSIYAWQFVAWRSQYAERVPLAYKIIVTAYPFGDLVFLALLLRLLLSRGLKNVSLLLMVGWFVLLLPSDLGWPMFVRAGVDPSRDAQYFMEATWSAACVLLGLAPWHPDVRAITHQPEGGDATLDGFGWFGLLACVVTGPLVVVLQVVLDRLYSLTSF